MAYASTAMASSVIRVPSVAMPKFVWPRPSARARAL